MQKRTLGIRVLSLLLLLLGAVGPRAQAQDEKARALIGELATADVARVWKASNALIDLGEDALAPVRAGLDSESESVRLGCARALLLQGEEERPLEILLKIVTGSSSEQVRRNVIDLLVQSEISEAAKALWDASPQVLDPETKVKLLWGVWNLSSAFRDPAGRQLKAMLQSDDPNTAAQAALALADIRDYESAMPVLERVSEEPTERGRLARLYIQMRLLDKYLTLLSEQTSRRDDAGSRGDSGAKAHEGVGLTEAVKQMIRDIHSEVEVQGWKPKELDAFLDEEAARGMLRAMDPHSTLLTGDELEAWNYDLNPSYSGIGSYVQLDEADGLLILTQPMFGGPAWRKGIEPGDKVVRVDDWDAQGKSVDQITSRLKGPPGTVVQVSIYRKGWEKTRSIPIVRETIHIPTVVYGMLPGQVGYALLTTFGGETSTELEAALDDLEQQGMRTCVLDLRNNSGGYLEIARAIAGKFLKGRQVVCYWEGRPGIQPRETEVSLPSEKHRDVSLVILVNGLSASASEIVSGALKSHERATLVGTRTFGKGSVQRVLDLPKGVLENERFQDTRRKNGKWDEGEKFEDLNRNGRYEVGEPFIDEASRNGRWDAAEKFTDTNTNERYDQGEEFVDDNLDGVWSDAEEFEDANENGRYDLAPKVKLTLARYYLPNGESIHTERRKDGSIAKKGGVLPNVVIKPQHLDGWKVEEITRILESNKLDAYVEGTIVPDKKLLARLAITDDQSPASYPEFEALYASLETPLSKNDVRIYLRSRLRRAFANYQGKPLVSDFQEDPQLQRAIYEALQKVGRDVESIPEYKVFHGKVPQPQKEDDSEPTHD